MKMQIINTVFRVCIKVNLSIDPKSCDLIHVYNLSEVIEC